MQTLILDSSQITSWYECPQMWANRGLIAINTRDKMEAPAAGTLGHKYLEIYYTELAMTEDKAKAAAETFKFDPDAADQVDEQFPLSEDLRKLVRQRVTEYFMWYPNDYIPAYRSKHLIGAENGTLIDIVGRDPLIEKGFSYKLFESKEYLFVLEGRIDFMGRLQTGEFFWMDHKFQFKESVLHPKSVQFRNYSLATGLPVAVINYVRLHKEVKQNTFLRQPISFSARELTHWRQELIEEVYIPIAKQVASGNFPKHRSHCKFCQFTPLCDEYNPEIRAGIQKRDFTTKKEWRPW